MMITNRSGIKYRFINKEQETFDSPQENLEYDKIVFYTKKDNVVFVDFGGQKQYKLSLLESLLQEHFININFK
jgi:hypothetical protein